MTNKHERNGRKVKMNTTHRHQHSSAWLNPFSAKLRRQQASNGCPETVPQNQHILWFGSLVHEVVPARSGVFGNAMNGRMSFTISKPSVVDHKDIGFETRSKSSVKHSA